MSWPPEKRRIRLPGLRPVQRRGSAYQRLEGILIHVITLMDIDRAPDIAFEAGVE
jgi:hypothetical protein